jgi:hypothetical protein
MKFTLIVQGSFLKFHGVPGHNIKHYSIDACDYFKNKYGDSYRITKPIDSMSTIILIN